MLICKIVIHKKKNKKKTTITSVIRNAHSRTEILHQRNSILATKVNKLDTLDPGGEVDPIAPWIITMLCSI